MTVTKQQQLEWLVKHIGDWCGNRPSAYLMSCNEIGFIIGLATQVTPKELLCGGYHLITQQEWQQERDTMSGKPEVDSSWRERGEFPPVGCECEVFVSDENKWMHFEVIAIRDGHVLGWCREGSCGFQSNDKSDFRQLRTEREKAIDEMVYEFIDYHGDPKGGERYLAIATKLYNAGYRKEAK